MKLALSTLIPIALMLSLPACAKLPTGTQLQAASPVAACQPAPCATLNAQELDFVGSILMQKRNEAGQQYKALDAVIQNVQGQINQQNAAAAPTGK